MLARTLMVQGTTSSAGKSLLVTALCRMLHQRGIRVAPFKSQNMALNAYVTADGKEIGRAQAVQAEAAGIAPTADMNPILIKPEGDRRSQIVVLGRSIGSLTAVDYHQRKLDLREVIAGSLRRLREAYDVVVIEGAGSPAEINLRDRELVNMHVARAADAPVLLVGDIDRGGVFAAFVGTLELLEPADRRRIAGFVVNKFRGDISLLQPGLDYLTARTGIPVAGVVPYIPDLRIAEEDSIALDERALRGRPTTDQLDICVVRLPRVSNYDDFETLEHEPGVVVRFAESAAALAGADLVIIPGSKSTSADLAWMRQRGIADAILIRAGAGLPVLGICGGCQMLGQTIEDPERIESDTAREPGLGLLPLRTRFGHDKLTAQVTARLAADSLLGASGVTGTLSGYEIHMGLVELVSVSPSSSASSSASSSSFSAPYPFVITSRNGVPCQVSDGAVAGSIVGTMIHGILNNDTVREALLFRLRQRRALLAPAVATDGARPNEYDRLATIVRNALFGAPNATNGPLSEMLAGLFSVA
jgi:adenosylcobyric acid synthase